MANMVVIAFNGAGLANAFGVGVLGRGNGPPPVPPELPGFLVRRSTTRPMLRCCRRSPESRGGNACVFVGLADSAPRLHGRRPVALPRRSTTTAAGFSPSYVAR